MLFGSMLRAMRPSLQKPAVDHVKQVHIGCIYAYTIAIQQASRLRRASIGERLNLKGARKLGDAVSTCIVVEATLLMRA